MKESYDRQPNYPIGRPFSTDVIRDTLKKLERGVENIRYRHLSGLEQTMPWNAHLQYLTTGVTNTYEPFHFNIDNAGTVTFTASRDIVLTFGPSNTYPSNLKTTASTPVTTAYACFVGADGTAKNKSLSIFPKSTATYGDMYIKDVVFTFNHDATATSISVAADTDSAELLPNGDTVYYKWTVTYDGTSDTLTDVYNYLNGAPPTVFSDRFAVDMYAEAGAGSVLMGTTDKDLFFVMQGTKITIGDGPPVTALQTGFTEIFGGSFTDGDPEKCVYVKVPYVSTTRDNVEYYSHVNGFRGNIQITSDANILYSWNMDTTELDYANLIPIVYRKSACEIEFIDGTFYTIKPPAAANYVSMFPTDGNSFYPSAVGATRFYQLGISPQFSEATFSVTGPPKVILNVWDTSDNRGYLSIGGVFLYDYNVAVTGGNPIFTYYRYRATGPGTYLPIAGFDSQNGQVYTGGGTSDPNGAASGATLISLAHNGRAATDSVVWGDGVHSIVAPDATSGQRAATLYGQYTITDVSGISHIAQGASAGWYFMTETAKMVLGLHDGTTSNDLTDTTALTSGIYIQNTPQIQLVVDTDVDLTLAATGVTLNSASDVEVISNTTSPLKVTKSSISEFEVDNVGVLYFNDLSAGSVQVAKLSETIIELDADDVEITATDAAGFVKLISGDAFLYTSADTHKMAVENVTSTDTSGLYITESNLSYFGRETTSTDSVGLNLAADGTNNWASMLYGSTGTWFGSALTDVDGGRLSISGTGTFKFEAGTGLGFDPTSGTVNSYLTFSSAGSLALKSSGTTVAITSYTDATDAWFSSSAGLKLQSTSASVTIQTSGGSGTRDVKLIANDDISFTSQGTTTTVVNDVIVFTQNVNATTDEGTDSVEIQSKELNHAGASVNRYVRATLNSDLSSGFVVSFWDDNITEFAGADVPVFRIVPTGSGSAAKAEIWNGSGWTTLS